MIYNELGWNSEVLISGFTIYRFGKLRIMSLTGVSINASGTVYQLATKDCPPGTVVAPVMETIAGGKAYPALTNITYTGDFKIYYYNPTGVSGTGVGYGSVVYYAG